MALKIDGLLPGVEAVRLGTCGADEFEQHGSRLVKGPRGSSQVVVKPLPGWEFVYSIRDNCYEPVQNLPTKRAFTVLFEASTGNDMAVIDALKNLSSFISLTETTQQPASAEMTS